MSTEISSFHGSQEIKDKYMGRVRRHREQDELVQGIYWDGKQGCAVGCALEVDDIQVGDVHDEYERQLGIPVWLARLQDRLFERALPREAMEWPERLLHIIPVGADRAWFDRVRYFYHAFCLRLLVSHVAPLDDALRWPEGVDVLRRMLEQFERRLGPSDSEWTETNRRLRHISRDIRDDEALLPLPRMQVPDNNQLLETLEVASDAIPRLQFTWDDSPTELSDWCHSVGYGDVLRSELLRLLTVSTRTTENTHS